MDNQPFIRELTFKNFASPYALYSSFLFIKTKYCRGNRMKKVHFPWYYLTINNRTIKSNLQTIFYFYQHYTRKGLLSCLCMRKNVLELMTN